MSDVKEFLDQNWRSAVQSKPADDPEESPYTERVVYWRERVAGSYGEGYDYLLSRNCSPRIAAAVCHYVAGLEGDMQPTSQSEIAAEFNISRASVRNWYPVLVERRQEHR